MSGFKSQFNKIDGSRWIVLFGDCNDVESFALKECVMMLQASLPYTVELKKAVDFSEEDFNNHLFIIGTLQNNHLLEEFNLDIPANTEGYCISNRVSPWNPECRSISICGGGSAGCLYGVEHFNTEILGSEYVLDIPEERATLFENIADFSISESPVIQDRGIWTWGYPIYDYQNFIDNMARLRMNTLIIWNDVAPLNLADVIDYAKKRGIKIIPGFHWGWGKKLDLSSRDVIEKIKKHVCDSYTNDYAKFDHAGIYFQTLTETTDTELNSVPIIKLACDMVNEIAQELLKKNPDLKIYFGLHATSVQDNFGVLEELDPRVSIIWEDAGVIPYYGEAVTKVDEKSKGGITTLNTVEKTIDYSKKITALRDRKEFKIVAKGFPYIRWKDFENHKQYIMGAQTPLAIKQRLEDRMNLWTHSNLLWQKNYPQVLRFFNEVLALDPKETMVTALIEDSMFEAGIQDGPALFGAMLWNPNKDKDHYMKYVSNNYYRQLKLY
jgi:hypothetical protein